MKRTIMTGMVLVLAMALWAGASAQTTTNAARQNQVQAAVGPRFVDANGDGICDNLALGGGFGRGMRGGFGRGMRGGAGAGLAFGQNGLSLVDSVARVTGQERAAVLQALQSGKTLAQIGEAAGRSAQDLVEGLLEERRATVSQAVSDGRLTAQQAEQLMAWMKTRLELSVQGRWQPGGGGFRGLCPWGAWPAGSPVQQQGR
ncbi:MAG: hypothetical protein PHQ53_14005 [Candidatus Krumholzibacteria bacterium]|nr:hypothetical protein [Candidatus Krumholzibacteria bacterium]